MLRHGNWHHHTSQTRHGGMPILSLAHRFILASGQFLNWRPSRYRVNSTSTLCSSSVMWTTFRKTLQLIYLHGVTCRRVVGDRQWHHFMSGTWSFWHEVMSLSVTRYPATCDVLPPLQSLPHLFTWVTLRTCNGILSLSWLTLLDV